MRRGELKLHDRDMRESRHETPGQPPPPPRTQHPSSLTGLLSEQMAMKSLSVFGSTPSTLHLEDTPQALTTPTPSKATLGEGGGGGIAPGSPGVAPSMPTVHAAVLLICPTWSGV